MSFSQTNHVLFVFTLGVAFALIVDRSVIFPYTNGLFVVCNAGLLEPLVMFEVTGDN